MVDLLIAFLFDSGDCQKLNPVFRCLLSKFSNNSQEILQE